MPGNYIKGINFPSPLNVLGKNGDSLAVFSDDLVLLGMFEPEFSSPIFTGEIRLAVLSSVSPATPKIFSFTEAGLVVSTDPDQAGSNRVFNQNGVLYPDGQIFGNGTQGASFGSVDCFSLHAVDSIECDSLIDTAAAFSRSGIQVVGQQQAAVADAAGGVVVDVQARAKLNDLLAKLRTHGLIAT